MDLDSTAAKVIEGTVVLVMLYLVVAHSKGFGDVVGAVGGQYVSAVQALQGPKPS